MNGLGIAIRSLRASPGYSLLVVVTVALGIAASTTIVSFMSPYLIRELPFGEPERLVQIGQVDPVAGYDSARLSLAMFRDWEERTRSFEELGTYTYQSKNSAASRRREMGRRMALGATGKEVSRLVLAEGLKLAGTGIVLGLALAAIAAKLMASLLYGIGPFDLVTFVVVTGVFLITAILATLLPARRAARTDPIGVLRWE